MGGCTMLGGMRAAQIQLFSPKVDSCFQRVNNCLPVADTYNPLPEYTEHVQPSEHGAALEYNVGGGVQ